MYNFKMSILKNDQGWVRTVALAPPTLQDNTADADRLTGALKIELKTDAVYISFDLLKKLPDLLRKWNYNISCILFKDLNQWILVNITAAENPGPVSGLAVDLGTSRVVLRLLDLLTGNILAESSFDNPQASIGPDVLARIHYAGSEKGLQELNDLIIDGLNQNIVKLCRSGKLNPEQIYLLSVAGNTAMTHLFMGLKPDWIIREPYIPVVNRPGILKIKVNHLARVVIFPNIGSYFGGDLIAGILFSGINETDDTAILVDVGTNAEVVLGNKNWLIACAGAAGPALEGGVTRMGMMAGPGVIEKIDIDPATGNYKIETIGNLPPKGICGSGVIDLAAGLFNSGMLDIRGKLVPSACGGRIKEKDGIKQLVVVPAKDSGTGTELTISQADFDSLIRSKAAMYTILETTAASVEMSLQELAAFYVGGTFGSFINPESAITIGMLPDLPLASYKPLGNSSLEGASMVLSSRKRLEEIDKIRDKITYLELNVNQDFMNRFSAAKFLPHTNKSLFPSKMPP